MNFKRLIFDTALLTSAVTTDISFDSRRPLDAVNLDTFILICLTVLYLAASLSSSLDVRVFPPLLTDKHVFPEPTSASWFSPWLSSSSSSPFCLMVLTLADTHTHACTSTASRLPTKHSRIAYASTNFDKYII